ncbi:rho-related protein racA-like [Ylistrum balloti]|uniref:rho-related protein racA-like n=1 Tax=Ylistrum balloti TaxID=509963 RepID=UPI0029058DB1|nr:rho-related protein racA-like [Ylistrum balloti]
MVTHLKLVAVGDGGVGKSCLLIANATGHFPHAYVPTVFGSWVMDLRLKEKDYRLALWDTAGQVTIKLFLRIICLAMNGDFFPQEDYDRLRPLSYPGSDIVFICFSVNNRDSFENIREKWIPELHLHCPNVPKVLVACKTDLRHTGTGDYVTYAEGSKVAKDLGLRYQETSALNREGLTSCFSRAITEATEGLAVRRRKKERLRFFKRTLKEIPSPPNMPPTEKAPWIDIATSRFADDWRGMLEKPIHSDVTFILGEGKPLAAHKLVMCCSSSFFCQVLGMTPLYKSSKTRSVANLHSFSHEAMNAGRIEGISKISEEIIQVKGQRRRHTTIKLNSNIKQTTFTSVLEFLYTGIPNLLRNHRDINLQDLNDIITVSRIFKLTRLGEICQNYVMEHDFLNPSIGSFLNDETGQKMKELYFNNPEHADVVFNVQGQTIYAHRVVLCARCGVLATMFRDQLRGEIEVVMKVDIPATSAEGFLAFLEYLYTDHAPIEEVDVLGLIVLADMYDQKRLINMCELYITKQVERSVTKQIKHANIDVIGVLLASQVYNAHQLTAWCLHFISSNYTAFKHRSDFYQLKGDNLELVTKNQWPPVSYLKQIAEYQIEWTGNDVECSLM